MASRVGLGLLLAALVAAGAACSSRQNPSLVGPSGGSPGSPAGTAVSFTTSDGLKLTGRLFGSGSRTGVTLAHMFPADATSWYPAARRLAGLGYMALAFNFRGYDGSAGAKNPSKADVDLQAAYDFLRTRGAQQVALVGASMGGTASLILAASAPTPAVVTISAPLSFQGLSAEPVAAGIHAPVLLLASKGDVSAAQSLRTLADLVPGAEAKLFDGEAHGTNLFDARPEALDEVTAFLQSHAPVASPTPAPASASP